ncbi:MAG TPA: hypothetical protein VN621_09205 [Arthrobacter sp.]|nr:hypothetical protein [Arthrobacter sp.]
MTSHFPTDDPEAGPLACAASLRRLVEQVGSPPAAAFVDRFVRLWPGRLHRLHVAVAGRDADAGRDAALSLVSGASMAGALRLAGLGTRLHAQIPDAAGASAWHPAELTLADIDRCCGESLADVVRLARHICPSAPGAEPG